MRLSAYLRMSVAVLGVVLGAAAGVRANPLHVVWEKIGRASWYGSERAAHRTASGRRFDPRALTAAHRWLPFGSRVRVTNLANGRSVLLTITDRGPWRRQREIDLSYGAAQALDMIRRGVAPVRIELLAAASERSAQARRN